MFYILFIVFFALYLWYCHSCTTVHCAYSPACVRRLHHCGYITNIYRKTYAAYYACNTVLLFFLFFACATDRSLKMVSKNNEGNPFSRMGTLHNILATWKLMFTWPLIKHKCFQYILNAGKNSPLGRSVERWNLLWECASRWQNDRCKGSGGNNAE